MDSNRYNKQLFDAMLRNMANYSDAIWEYNLYEGRVHVLVDNILPDMEGAHYTIDQAKQLTELYNDPSDAERIFSIMRPEVLGALRDTVIFESKEHVVDGKKYALKRTVTPVFDEDGRVCKVLISFKNQVNTDLGEKENKNYAFALSHDYAFVVLIYVDEGLVEIKKEWGYDIASVSFTGETKHSFEDGWEMFVRNCVHPDDQKEVLKAGSIEVLKKKLKKNKEYTYNFRTVNDGLHYFQARYVVAGENRILAGYRIVDDVMKHDLEQRQLIEDALARAEKANAAKTIFLNNMSHDIRTPMNAIMGFTGLALSNVKNTEKVSEYLNKIQISSAHLLSLINDVLDMSRIESGKISFNRTDVTMKEVIENIRSIVQADANAKKQKLRFEMVDVKETVVLCDTLRLDQLLLNCLSNAIKYTPEGGMISLTVTQIPAELENYSVYEFRIKDTGIGMDKRFLKHIYEPFTREKNTTVSGIQGTGLGMSIVKNLVDLNGGTIDIISEKGKGTEIIVVMGFEISKNQSRNKDEAQEKLATRNLDDVNILLVEDNLINQEIALEILKQKGATVEVASDGNIAVEKVSEADAGYYDIVLMDIQMPIMNGYEATREIRALKDRKKAAVPIVAMTANAFDEDRQMAMEAGMNGHIAKPIDVAVLVDTIIGIVL